MGVIIYVISLFFFGYLISIIIKYKAITNFEFIILTLLYGLFGSYLFSLLLLLFNLYTPKVFIVLISTLSFSGFVIYMIRQYCHKIQPVEIKLNKQNIFSAILLVISITIIFFIYERPNEFVVHGFLDTSNYINQAAYINNSHLYYMSPDYIDEINLDNELLYTNFESYHQIHGKYDSLLINGRERYELPFYILYKLALSNLLVYANVKVALYLSFIFLLLLLFVFIIVINKLIKNIYVSILLSLAFAITPILIINARNTMTEILTLLIIMFYVNFFVNWYYNLENSRLVYNINMLFISTILLLRSDGLLIVGCIFLVESIKNKHYFEKSLIISQLVLIAVFSFIAYNLNPNYTIRSYHNNIYVYFGLLIIILLCGIFMIKYDIASLIIKRVTVKTYNIFGYLMALIFLLLLFVVPAFMNHFNEINQELLKIFSHYPGLVFQRYIGLFYIISIAIIPYIFKTENSLKYLAFSFLPISILYSFNLLHSPDLFWASRRLIYSLFPLLILGFLCLFYKLRNNNKLMCLCLIILLGQNIYLNYVFAIKNDQYYLGYNDSLGQMLENINTDYVGIPYLSDQSLGLVNYINNFTNKKAFLLLNDNDIEIAQNNYTSLIVSDLSLLTMNHVCNKYYITRYFPVEYIHYSNKIRIVIREDYYIINY